MPDKTIDSILEGRRSQPHQLIEVLQDIQEHHGYIPEDAMRSISDDLGNEINQILFYFNLHKEKVRKDDLGKYYICELCILGSLFDLSHWYDYKIDRSDA